MREEDIRPADIFNEYLRLSAEDARTFFADAPRHDIPCVACGSNKVKKAFEKHGFGYATCDSCHSLFQTPRPPIECFEKFYYQSRSSDYWARVFFPVSMKNRRELIFRPRAERISDLCRERRFQAKDVLDVGAGHGLFLEEWRKLHPESRVMAVEPGKELAEVCRGKGIETLEAVAEKADAWHGKADLVTCFEVIEHAHRPVEFLTALRKLVKKGGYAVVTGLGGDGFDVQVLWERSKSVSPPHHINFMSVEGFQSVFQNAGFTDVQVLTPGKLDVDIVRNTLKESGGALSRFEQTLLRRGESALKNFQQFLAENQLSSHTWVMARNP